MTTTENFRCHAYKKCGGCQLDVTYREQLSYKQRTVIKMLGRFCRVMPIIGMDKPLHYRCKVSNAFGYSRGQVISGIWQSSSGRLAKIDTCALEDERASVIIAAIKKLLPMFKLKTYDEQSRSGFLRFVTIRIGKSSGEILVALGTNSGVFPAVKNFVQALVKACPNITTITRNVSTDRLNLLLGKDETILYGDGFITDRLCGYDFRISARSFFQINPTQTEKLYSTAVEFAALTGDETVIDAYCGVGTIGIIASKKAKQVISVEQNTDAVKNAIENVKLSGIKNVNVICGDAGEFMQELASAGESIDTVFTDPPRAGCSKQFLKSLITLSPKKIVYVSCNPETLGRDLYFLTKSGYNTTKIQPVDMFPYTKHIETVVLLSRENANDCRKETKMISDERRGYKSWSNLKKQMHDLLCDSLKDKISYFYTSYHEVHNAYGRATINYNKKEILAFSWVEMYAQEREVSQLYEEGKKASYGELEKGKWMPECKLCDADFINSLTIYLKTDIATSLNSDNYLLRVFAYMDRRVGKRTLIKIKDDVEKLPDWVKQFYQIRCEADGIVFPPKRITDECVVLLERS